MKKISKSILSVLLIATMLFSTVIVSSAQGDVITGKADDNFICDFDTNTGVLTISGLGMLFAGDVESALRTEDLSIVKEIVVKEGITLFNVFGWEGSHNFNNVTAITLPKSLKRIGSKTFSMCDSLQVINYGGNQADWETVIIDDGNDAIKNATINYNCQVPVTEGADTYDYSMVDCWQRNGYKITLDYYSGEMRVTPDSTKKGVAFTEELWLAFEFKPYWFDGYIPSIYATSLVFDEGITSIGTDALINLEIHSLSLPKSLVEIEREAFGDGNMYEKSKLKKVYYAGSIADYKAIDIGVNNIPIFTAEKIYASKVSAKSLTYKLSKKYFTYNGKTQYPNVTIKDKNGNILENGKDYIAEYWDISSDTRRKTIRVTLMGEYKGQKTLYYYIKPKAPVMSKLTKRKNGINVVWEKYDEKKCGDITGYEIQYSTSADFSTAETIKIKNQKNYARKITGLKSGKKYYVRIRAYKNSFGVVNSSWSKVKNIKVG